LTITSRMLKRVRFSAEGGSNRSAFFPAEKLTFAGGARTLNVALLYATRTAIRRALETDTRDIILSIY
jgi:hypothetical protein